MDSLIPRVCPTDHCSPPNLPYVCRDNVEKVTRPLLDLICGLTGMQTVYFTHIDWQAGVQRVLFLRQGADLPLAEGMDVPLEHTLCERALHQQQFFVPDIREVWGDKSLAVQLGIVTYASAPVADIGEGVYGTLCAISKERREIRPEHERIFAVCADIITRQIEREHLLAKIAEERRLLEELAMLDPLTGLFNRRALEVELARLVGHTRRHGGTIFLGFVDLDGFKSINDRWGHEVGDAMLREVASRLRKVMRKEDVVGRLGGDEFLLMGLLDPAADDEFEGLKRRIEKQLAGIYALGTVCFEYRGPSMGWIKAAGVNLEPKQLIEQADRAMYEVKKRRKQNRD